MIFESVLHQFYSFKEGENNEVPDYFYDLNLNQIVSDITKGKEEYNLKPFFYAHWNDPDLIYYRHCVMRELENEHLYHSIKSFGTSMREIRSQLSLLEKLHYPRHKERLFLDIVLKYCNTVFSLNNNIGSECFYSEGFTSFQRYLKKYVLSENFTVLYNESRNLVSELSKIEYCIFIKDLKVQIREFKMEEDYGEEVETTFAKFKQGNVKDYRVNFPQTNDINHVEAQILDGVASLNPEIFDEVSKFYTSFKNFQETKLLRFDREIHFYLAYLEYISPLKSKGLMFCYPTVSNNSKEVYCLNTFDLALAKYLTDEKQDTITNDFNLAGNERVIVVSGPNQGGKTTFARTFGQLHFLAGLGCPVPGSNAKLFLYDKLFTHFEREENITNLRSKLEDDLFRIHNILSKATPNSIIILNEILTSTTLQDGIFLSQKIMEQISRLDLLAVWVTFIEEISSYNEKTVSMVAGIMHDNLSMRNFKICRSPANGLAFAISVAERYGLAYNSLKDRLKQLT